MEKKNDVEYIVPVQAHSRRNNYNKQQIDIITVMIKIIIIIIKNSTIDATTPS